MASLTPYGTGVYGFGIPYGSLALTTTAFEQALGDFQFEVIPMSEGSKIKIRFYAPTTAEAPQWSRRLRILRKIGEWAQSYDDADAYETVDSIYATSGTYTIIETDLVPGQLYYYSLYTLSVDGNWIHIRFTDRGSAYPYDRWGCAEYMFNSLPRGWRTEDITIGDLFNFMTIFGALADDIKTDCEHLLTLFSIEDIHEDLIWLIDRKLGWPTWHETSGIQKRQETLLAVSLYKIGLGTPTAYEAILEEISSWDVEIVEGWKYVFFSNGQFDSVTPDLSTVAKQEEIQRLYGRRDDLLKYTNDTEEWHAVNGLAFFLTEIPGVSEGLTGIMVDRFNVMIEWSKASYANTHLILEPTTEEIVQVPVDTWYDYLFIHYEEMGLTTADEDIYYTTTDLDMFISTAAASTTNTLSDRTYHEEISYV